MYRCPTCVSVLVDATVRRCPVCGANLKRHPPTIIGMDRRNAKVTSWDVRATAEASKIYGREAAVGTEPDIDLPSEHLRDSSGRTAGTERG